MQLTREGAMPFGTFARTTAHRWQRLAHTLLRRWPGPYAVDEEDVAQELLLGAWLALPRWQPQGAPLERFVVWQAMAQAKAWLHRQRAANQHGSRDRNPSRFDVVAIGDEDIDMAVEAAQEEVVYALERLRLACTLLANERAGVGLVAMAMAGSVDGGLTLLADETETRRGLILALQSAYTQLENRDGRREAY